MRHLASVIILLLCVSCSTARDPSEYVYTGKAPELHVRLAKQQVVRGENLTAILSIDNKKQPPHRLDFATGCQFDWTITTADSVVFTTRCIMCSQAASSIILAGTLYTTSIFIPTKRLCEVPWPFKEDVLPVGRYTLSVFAIGYEDQFVTNVVEFDIVDRE